MTQLSMGLLALQPTSEFGKVRVAGFTCTSQSCQRIETFALTLTKICFVFYTSFCDVGSGLRRCADQCQSNAPSDPRCPGQAYRSGNLKKTDYWFG